MRHKSVVLLVPSTEINLFDVVDVRYLANKTHTPTRSLHPWTFRSQATINISEFTSSKLFTVLGSFPIFTTPRNVVVLSTTSPTHPRISRLVQNHSGVHYYDVLSPSEPVSGLWRNERRSASVLLLLVSVNSILEQTQCQNYHPSSYVHRNSYGDYRLRAAQYPLWRVDGCNTPVPFICYPRLPSFQ